MDAIQMEPSVGTRGVPNVMGQRLVKPVLKRKPKFSKTIRNAGTTMVATVGSMFDHDYYSLIAANMYPKFPLETPVEVYSVMQDGERIMVVRGAGREYTAFGNKIFVEKI